MPYLIADGSSASAWVEIDLGSNQNEVWVTFDVLFDSAALALWTGSFSGYLIQLFDPAHSFDADFLLISGGQWQDGLETGGTPVADAWVTCELRYVFDDGGGNLISQFYVGGSLLFDNTFPSAGSDEVRYVRIGNDNGPTDPASIVFFDNVKVGTTRGADDLFSDDFEEGTLDAWTSSSGDVSVFPPPTPEEAPAVTRVKVAFTDGPLVVSPTWTDLASLDGVTVQEWSLERGRKDELSKTGTGSATVRLIDREGVLDPTNGGSSLFPNVLPDKQIVIELWDPVQEEWQTRFRGVIEDYDYTLAEVTESHFRVTIEAVDFFGILNDQELEPGVAGNTLPPEVAEGNVFYEDGNVDDRILAILADVGSSGFPSGLYSIFSGNVSVQEVVYAPGTQALAALFDAADAEFPGVANLYCDREGILTFHGRQARFRPDVAQYGIRRQTVGDPSVTDGDATVCPIAELSFDLGKSAIYNSVLAYPQGIDPDDIYLQLVEDATSISAHGKKGLSFTDLLTGGGLATGNTAAQECVLIATYYRDNYKDPLPRLRRLVFKTRMPSARLAGPLWKMLCRSDISDLLTVKTAHPGGGGFDETGYYIEGLRQTCQPANALVPYVVLELDVSPQALFTNNPFDDDPDPDE